MENNDDSGGGGRAFLQLVADEFKRLSRTRRSEAVLEPANAGASFADDIVRAKFRIQKRRDINAAGLIVTADADEPSPADVSASDVARAILERVEALEEVGKGKVVRVAYSQVPLSEIVRDIL